METNPGRFRPGRDPLQARHWLGTANSEGLRLVASLPVQSWVESGREFPRGLFYWLSRPLLDGAEYVP